MTMLLAEAGCAFMCFILYISDCWGQATSICALQGSSVDLPCSAKHLNSTVKWYNVQWDDYKFGQSEISPDGYRVVYNIEKDSTLTIKDLRESDENLYCCTENADNPELCRYTGTKLHVADLQVKVIPSSEGQTVSLMCSTSCPLTEKPAAYIWYKNREFLYEDWSPWYQELVSSEEAVTYSCAVKGYEDLTAPQVSVVSVSPTCFSVTYAKGRMCSHKLTSVNEPCSITYPREVHVEQAPAEGYLILTCATSCTLTDPQTAYRWYHNGYLYKYSELQRFEISRASPRRVSCAVKGHEDLLSDEVHTWEETGWRVNYVNRRICALEGSAVNISSEYVHPDNQPPELKSWYKMKRGGKQEAGTLTEAAGRVEYHDDVKNRHILTIKKLAKDDSAEYALRHQKKMKESKHSDVPGVTLVVTGLTVTMTPSAEVTEGQRVTLTCSTSCPLTDNTNYIWFLNSRPLRQNKHLVLDPVSIQHAGNYSCGVKTHENMTSAEEALTVRALVKTMVIINAVRLTVGFLILISLIPFLWWTRKKKLSTAGRNHQGERCSCGRREAQSSAESQRSC